MATASDVARHITESQGSMSAMKLQKLVYFAHAWHLVATDGRPLIDEPIEAWTHGPVVRRLWEQHRGQTTVSAQDFGDGDVSHLSEQAREVVAAVLAKYGDWSASRLRSESHSDSPWRDAATVGAATIEDSAMYSFYSLRSAHDGMSVTLPGWAAIVVASDEYEEMLRDVDVPDDASSLIDSIRNAQASLC